MKPNSVTPDQSDEGVVDTFVFVCCDRPQRLMIDWPAELDVTQIDRHDHRVEDGCSIRTAPQNDSPGWDENPREVFVVVHEMCGWGSTQHLGVIIVPLEKTRRVEIERLNSAVGRNAGREGHSQSPPCLALLLPRLDFFRFDTFHG
jgi:hypothetical protein